MSEYRWLAGGAKSRHHAGYHEYPTTFSHEREGGHRLRVNTMSRLVNDTSGRANRRSGGRGLGVTFKVRHGGGDDPERLASFALCSVRVTWSFVLSTLQGLPGAGGQRRLDAT